MTTQVKQLRCAAYSRVSTDRQNPLSVEDQLHKCRQFAEHERWRVLEEHIYSDTAISGTTDNRPGLQKLLAALKQRPCPFDILLVDDTSRLSRKAKDTLTIYERLNFAGVRLVAISQGIDSENEQAEVLMQVHGMVDSLYVNELATKTRRGMEGALRRGMHPGGRCFGYRNVPIEDPSRTDERGRPVILGVRLEVNEEQAAIVRRIFGLYSRGYGLKQITKLLNGEHVPSPQPQAGRLSQSWCPSSLRVILHNDRYRGVVIWGKTKKVRSADSGRKLARPRAESEWVKQEVPEQRIVSEEMWAAVRERMALLQKVYGRNDGTGLMRATAVRSPYIFSGLMKCSLCGANITVVSGRWLKRQDVVYGCPLNANRGSAVCSNNARIRRNVLETQMLAGLQEKVLHPKVIEYALQRFEEALTEQMAGLDSELEQMRSRKANLEKEIQNLTDRIATGDPSPSIMAAVTARERELSRIAIACWNVVLIRCEFGSGTFVSLLRPA